MSSFDSGKTTDPELTEVFHSYTRGVCPICWRLLDGARIIRDRKVFIRKHCPEHGMSEALLSGDAHWYLRSLAYTKPGQIPLKHTTEVSKGCPFDCGLCADHEQHTCLPIVEITNHCDMRCPICLVQNSSDYHLPSEDFRRIIDGLVESEGSLDNVNLSGGEPTVHPEFLDLVDIACRPEISRVSVSTNGLRLSHDLQLCEELAARNVYVSLQLDTMDDEKINVLRNHEYLSDAKIRTLDNLEALGVRHSLVCTVVKGVNDSDVGECVRLLLERDSVLSLMFQPAAFVGRATDFRPQQPLDRMTIPDVIRCIEEQTNGVLKQTDFTPMPCSHPSCFALTYLLKTDNGYVPFPRFVDIEKYQTVIANRGAIRPDRELEDMIRDVINELWCSSGQIPDSDRILKALRRAIDLMYPEDRGLELRERIHIGEGLVKTIFIHQFMDAHTFEMERVKKCCNHYAFPGGRLVPACVHNVFSR